MEGRKEKGRKEERRKEEGVKWIDETVVDIAACSPSPIPPVPHSLLVPL